jgi:hypothetical protein
MLMPLLIEEGRGEEVFDFIDIKYLHVIHSNIPSANASTGKGTSQPFNTC